MKLTITKFRQNIFRYLDKVVETGIPLEIERKGKIIKIILDKPKNKLDNLEAHDVIVGDYKDIDSIDWSREWSEEKNL